MAARAGSLRGSLFAMAMMIEQNHQDGLSKTGF